MQYRQFEEALVDMFGVDERSLGAFRARLRHLRKLGIPNIPTRGSGNAFNYKGDHLFITSIALALQTLGLPPTVSALIARHAAHQKHWLLNEKQEAFLIISSVPARAPNHLIDVLGIQPGVRGFAWINNQIGNQTFACVAVGAETAGMIVTRMGTIACSLINLSAWLRGSPREL